MPSDGGGTSGSSNGHVNIGEDDVSRNDGLIAEDIFVDEEDGPESKRSSYRTHLS